MFFISSTCLNYLKERALFLNSEPLLALTLQGITQEGLVSSKSHFKRYFVKFDIFFYMEKMLLCYTEISLYKYVFRVFWDVAPCSHVEVDQHFRCAYCLYHQGDE
jgi:hypothetical protein